MMFSLISDISHHAFLVTRTDGKDAISRLPMKILRAASLLVNPSRGSGFDFLHQIRHRDRPREWEEKVNMIFHGARRKQVSTATPNHPADIRMEIVAPIMLNPRSTVFRGENEMHQNVGQ